MQFINKLGEALFKGEAILVDTAIETNGVNYLKESRADGLFGFKVANHLQYFPHIALIGGLETADK